jgi:hypothetical protein
MYSEPTNTGTSGLRMVSFRTLFVSGFEMALAAVLLKTILKPSKKGTKPGKKGTKPDKKVRFLNG